MKKICVLLIILVFSFSTTAIAMDSMHNYVQLDANGPDGPAPNSGDGIPDGSGKDSPNGPNKGK